jgi:hypothetical protein
VNRLNFAKGAKVSLLSRAGRTALALVFLSSMTLSPAVWAGAFTFAGEANGVDVITHPKDYLGSGGVLNVGVCIDPASDFKNELVIPVKNNISVWNELQPLASNVKTGAVSGLDVESVLLHEMGHCIGLAHVNAASESGLGENDYTKATDGANNVFDVDPGPDGVPGTYDDLRGDDENMHWFNPNNNPFQLPIHTPVDTSEYRRDASELPTGDNFAQNASREMAADLGLQPAEAVMQQLTYYNETQRELISDGASTVMLAGSGLDETAGTSDDYQVVLTYEGITTGSNCDITVIIEDNGSFAYCSTGGAFVGSGHVRITSASIHLGSPYDWHFNTELRDGGSNQPPVAAADASTVDEDGLVDINVLGNDSDPDDDPLDVSSVGNPPHGSASINGNNTVRYTPDANYNGADSFSYTLSDGNGGTDTGNVNVTVNPVNDFPAAVNDSGITTAQDTPVDIYVLDNDSDVDNDGLNVSAVTNGSIGTVANNNGFVTYQPNPSLTGSDSFIYTASDGKGGTDSATVSVNVLAANQLPTAFFTGSCTGQSCNFDASSSNDPDGSIDSYSWNFGDGGTGSGLTPSHGYAAPGDYTVTLTVTDNRSGTDGYADQVTATADPVTPNYAVADFNAVQGTVSGSYQATQAAGGAVQSNTETHSGGRPNRRSDSLEHIWQFNLTGGNHRFNVVAQRNFPNGDLDSAFQFQWSTSPSGGWQNMLTVPGGSTSYDIGSGVSGNVYVRVIDNDSSQGNTVYSTVDVDHMYFDGGAPVTDPPAPAGNPGPDNNVGSVPGNTTLSWNAGSGADEHILYFGTNPDPDSQSAVSPAPGGTSYNPGSLAASTTYYWQVDERNAAGTTPGAIWQFTTSGASVPSELQVSSIVLGTASAGKGRKNGQAVVTVTDDFGNLISGATVIGTFTGSFSQTVSGNSSGSGTATLTTSTSPQKRNISFMFCVDSITPVSGLEYAPGTSNCQTY